MLKGEERGDRNLSEFFFILECLYSVGRVVLDIVVGLKER